MTGARARTIAELTAALDSGELSAEDRKRAICEANVVQQASAMRQLYRLTGNGLLIWHIFGLYRRNDLPVPEDVMRSLDRIGEELENASGPTSIAKALRLSGDRGGAQARSALSKSVRKLYILRDVAFYLRTHPRAAENEAFDHVAQKKKMTAGAIKQIWRRHKTLQAHADAPLNRVMRNWRQVR